MRAVKNNLPTPSGEIEESDGPGWRRAMKASLVTLLRRGQRKMSPLISPLEPSPKNPGAWDYGVFAHRKPGKYKLRNDGGSQYRSEERRARGLLFQEPPRITLNLPFDGPVGFCDRLFL